MVRLAAAIRKRAKDKDATSTRVDVKARVGYPTPTIRMI
jgi:hypothetical protein